MESVNGRYLAFVILVVFLVALARESQYTGNGLALKTDILEVITPFKGIVKGLEASGLGFGHPKRMLGVLGNVG